MPVFVFISSLMATGFPVPPTEKQPYSMLPPRAVFGLHKTMAFFQDEELNFCQTKKSPSLRVCHRTSVTAPDLEFLRITKFLRTPSPSTLPPLATYFIFIHPVALHFLWTTFSGTTSTHYTMLLHHTLDTISFSITYL